MNRKINPQTESVRRASVEEDILGDESKELNSELLEYAEQTKQKSKALTIQPIVEPKTYLSKTDELAEKVLQGDQQAVQEIASISDKARLDTENTIATYNREMVADQERMRNASTLHESEQEWIQQQVMRDEKRQAMQMIMRTFTQLQQMRIGVGNQVYAVGRKIILGLDPSQSDRELKGNEAAKIMKEMKADYNRVSEGMATRMLRNQDRFKDSRLDQFSYVLIALYLLIDKEEEALIDKIEALCANFEIYKRFLQPVPGVGPLTSGKIIALLDPTKANYSSSFVKYCGLDVVKVVNEETGEITFQGRSKRKVHLEERTYLDKDGKEQTKLSITYNPEAKCAMYNLAASLIKIKNRADRDKPLTGWPPHKVPVYADIYDDYKHRKSVENELKNLGRTKKHLDAMAKRYLEKIFLQELHPVWCYVLGMTDKVRLPYQLEHHDEIQNLNNFRYEPVFTPLRDIVATHAVRGRKQIDDLIRQGLF